MAEQDTPLSVPDIKERIQNMLPVGTYLTSPQIWSNLGIRRTEANIVLVANALLALKDEGIVRWSSGKFSRTSSSCE